MYYSFIEKPGDPPQVYFFGCYGGVPMFMGGLGPPPPAPPQFEHCLAGIFLSVCKVRNNQTTRVCTAGMPSASNKPDNYYYYYFLFEHIQRSDNNASCL